MSFRTKFLLKETLAKWFPGHMVKGMNILQKKLKHIDCILEVHDARIPLTGRNPEFRKHFTVAKPHILILNKVDLSDTSRKGEVDRHLQGQGINQVIYSNLKSGNPTESQYDKILTGIIKHVMLSDRYNRTDAPDINVAVIGIPNVGKSTLINRLRSSSLKGVKGAPAKVGASAGVTRAVMEKIRICDQPRVYIYDTPGILEPRANVKDVEAYMKIGLVSCLSDDVVGTPNIADYALFWLNKHGIFSYVDYFGLKEPSDSISDVLVQIAIKRNFIFQIKDLQTRKMIRRPNIQSAADAFLKSFRQGHLGRFLLDDDLLGDFLPFARDYVLDKKNINSVNDSK